MTWWPSTRRRIERGWRRLRKRYLSERSTLKKVRIAYQVFFLSLFLLLLGATTQAGLQGYPVSIFLEADPLLALGTMLSSHTLHAGLAWAGIVVAATLVFGRVFCSFVCPVGILNHVTAKVLPRRKPAEDMVRENRPRALYHLKYYVLVSFLVAAAFGALQVGILDPICLLGRSLSTSIFPAAHEVSQSLYPRQSFGWGWLIGALFLAVIVANRFLPRFFCRVLCPLGALLGFLSRFSLLRIHRDPDACTKCNKCAETCDGAAEPQKRTLQSECLMCFECVARCPHDALSYRLLPPKEGSVDMVSLGRRSLLGSALAGAAFLPLVRSSHPGGREGSPPKAYDPRLIRPPGSLPEEQLLAACVKCAACIKVCPTGALQPATFEAGLEGLWTPVAVYRLGNCLQRCNLCGSVCPTGAIRAFSIRERLDDEKTGVAPIRAGTAFYDRGRCLPWAMDTPCVKCEEFCPTSPKAIWSEEVTKTDRQGKTITLRQPRVDIDRCIGCGSCEWACPVSDPAVYVTNAHESRAKDKRLKLT